MRCLSCDEQLTTQEATRRVLSSGEYLDLCNMCYDQIKDSVITITQCEKEDEDEPDTM